MISRAITHHLQTGPKTLQELWELTNIPIPTLRSCLMRMMYKEQKITTKEGYTVNSWVLDSQSTIKIDSNGKYHLVDESHLVTV